MRPAAAEEQSPEPERWVIDYTSPGSRRWVFEQEGVDWTDLVGRTEKGPKKTVALIIGYNGHRLTGLMQSWHRSGHFVPTVESELELALLQAGAFIPSNFGNLGRLGWTRVARTDAGVSAACNVVTGRLIVDETPNALAELVERTRSFLPPEIELHGAACVQKRFDSRKAGAKRAYKFLLPSFCVMPGRLEAVRESLARRLERRPDVDPRDYDPDDLRAIEKDAELRQARLSREHLERFREALASFKGTHYFGNFANAKIDPGAPQGFRHIREMTCGDPFVDEYGREWLAVTICADSFLTHQIRKMLATAAEVSQGLLPLEFIRAAMCKYVEVITHKLPPQGLIFTRPYFIPSDRGDLVNDAIDSEEVQHRMEKLQQRLEKAVLEEQEAQLQYVHWLVCIAHFEKTEEMVAQTLDKYETVYPEIAARAVRGVLLRNTGRRHHRQWGYEK